MSTSRRTPSVLLLAALGGGLLTGCSMTPPTEVTDEHGLPDLREVDAVLLPAGLTRYDPPDLPYDSLHPVHEQTSLFEFEPSLDHGANHHCRAQITVSPHDPASAEPQAHIDALGTQNCDASWSSTADDLGWRQHPDDPALWILEFDYWDSGGFFGGDGFAPAVAAVVFSLEQDVAVGVWAQEEVWTVDDAVTVARGVAASVR